MAMSLSQAALAPHSAKRVLPCASGTADDLGRFTSGDFRTLGKPSRIVPITSASNGLAGLSLVVWGRSMAGMLSHQQIAEYRREGVVFPVRVLSAGGAATYRAACDELEARLGGKPRTIEVRQMRLHFRWAY